MLRWKPGLSSTQTRLPFPRVQACYPLEGIGELSATASRSGIAGLSTAQVLALVLLWLLTIGAPVVQHALPPETQTLLSNEYGTVGIAIALTLVIFGRQR